MVRGLTHSRFAVAAQTLVACALLAAAVPVAASDAGYRFKLTPHAGYRMGGTFEDRDTGSDYELTDNASYGLTLGIPWETNTELEFWYSHQPTDVDLTAAGGNARTGFDLDTLHIGGTVLLEPRGSAVPFVVLTAGATRVSSSEPGIGSDTFPSFSLGAGWQFFPQQRLGLRLEGRVLGTLVDSSSQVFCGFAPSGSGCLVSLSGDMLWQFEVNAGAVFRF